MTQKVVLRRLTPIQTIFFCALIGAVVCTPFAGQLVREVGHGHGGAEGWMVYLGICPTAIGFITWGFALSRTSALCLAGVAVSRKSGVRHRKAAV